MIGQLLQKRVNRVFLNLMRWLPVNPLKANVFGQHDVHGIDQLCQVNGQRFSLLDLGIAVDDIKIDGSFKFKEKYIVSYKRDAKVKKRKTLTIYLAELINPVDIVLTEHIGYQWIDWKPPHKIQENTIDPLLEQLADHWK